MSMARMFVMIFLGMFLWGSVSHAARFTGDYLLTVCAVDEDGKERVPGGHIACQAYIAGILDYHNLMRSLGTPPGMDFCVPPQVGLTTLHGQVAHYLFKGRDEHDDFLASPAVALTFFTQYPCQ